MPLAEGMVRRRASNLPPDLTMDDLRSAAYFALVDAASRYNPNAGVSFPTFAKLRISGEISDCLGYRRMPCVPENRDVEAPLSQDRLETEDLFRFIHAELGEEDGKSLCMYYVDERSLKEVGELRGVTESRASQIMKDCRDRLRRSIKRKDYR
jgi:hypothetical protein